MAANTPQYLDGSDEKCCKCLCLIVNAQAAVCDYYPDTPGTIRAYILVVRAVLGLESDVQNVYHGTRVAAKRSRQFRGMEDYLVIDR